MIKEIDFKGMIDETKEVLMENGGLNAMLFVAPDELKELVSRTTLLRDLGGISYDDFLKLDGNVQVSIDIKKEPATLENCTEIAKLWVSRNPMVSMALSYCNENCDNTYKIRITDKEENSLIKDFKERISYEILEKDFESALTEARLRQLYERQISQEAEIPRSVFDMQLSVEDRIDHIRFYTFEFSGRNTPIFEMDLASVTSPLDVTFNSTDNPAPAFVGCYNLATAPHLIKTFAELDIAVPYFSDTEDKIVKKNGGLDNRFVVIFNPDTMRKLDPIGTTMYITDKGISPAVEDATRTIYKEMKKTYQEMIKEREFLKKLPITGYDKNKYKSGTTFQSIYNERFTL